MERTIEELKAVLSETEEFSEFMGEVNSALFPSWVNDKNKVKHWLLEFLFPQNSFVKEVAIFQPADIPIASKKDILEYAGYTELEYDNSYYIQMNVILAYVNMRERKNKDENGGAGIVLSSAEDVQIGEQVQVLKNLIGKVEGIVIIY